MLDTRSISGPGDIDVFQRYSGSDDYIAWNGIYIQDGSETLINSNAYLTPAALAVDQDVSSFDAEVGEITFGGESGGLKNANQGLVSLFGSMDSRQVMKVDDHVYVFQDSNIDAEYGSVYSFVSDSDGTRAISHASVGQGTLSSILVSEAGNSARAFQNTNIEDAEHGYVESYATDSDGKYAGSQASVDHGTLSSILVSEAGNSVKTFQNTNIEDAEYGSVNSYARDVDGNSVQVSATIINGKRLSTTQVVESDDGLRSQQNTVIEDAEEGHSGSWAREAETDNYVGIGVRVYDGSLSATNLKSENHDGILSTSGETSLDTDDWGYTWADTWIGEWEDPDCKIVQLYSQVSKGSIDTRNLKSELDLGENVLKASGEVDLVTVDEGFASDSAWYGHDSSVGVRCHVSDGTFSADLQSEEDADIKVLTAFGEGYITPLGLGGYGYAVAGTHDLWVDENVNYGETLHAAMNSEISESGESARVDVL